MDRKMGSKQIKTEAKSLKNSMENKNKINFFGGLNYGKRYKVVAKLRPGKSDLSQ